MPLLTREQMTEILQVVKSMPHETWAPVVDKRADDAIDRMVRFMCQHFPAEHIVEMQAIVTEVVKLGVASALLEAVEVQRQQAAPASKGKATKADKAREITRRVSLLNRDENGARLTLKQLQPLVSAERVLSGLSADIDESTISRHLEGSLL